jgi:hypothetical protein|tara:strand:+ start:188 stop:343 length:156 start_codon:yes stop_codon:yes gene_type:complete
MHLFSGKKEIKLPKKGPTIVELTGHQDLQHFTLAVNSASRSAPVLLEIIHQ